MTLTARAFLDGKKGDWAWAVCEALRETPSGLGSRLSPLSVEAAAARGRAADVQALYDEVIRQPVPGGRRHSRQWDVPTLPPRSSRWRSTA